MPAIIGELKLGCISDREIQVLLELIVRFLRRPANKSSYGVDIECKAHIVNAFVNEFGFYDSDDVAEDIDDRSAGVAAVGRSVRHYKRACAPTGDRDSNL